MDAVKAATSNAAALLGMDDSVGTIEPGKLADLVLVSGDPMLDLGTLAHPELVMQGGRVYRPERVSDE
jgi:imidazolonepropionase-like amidohydrolase